MSRLIQSLESRTLFSATSAQAAVLLGDVKQVMASAATVRADLKAAMSAATTGVKNVATDLKTTTTSDNRASNAALLKTLKAGELSTFATLRGDETALLAVGAGLSARAAADARALLLHPTNQTIQAHVTADITALTTEPAARLATFQADAQGNLIGAALANLVNANPSNTALAADAVVFQAGGAAATAIGNVVSAAGSFNGTISALSTDVNSTTNGSTIPNLVGTYTGQVTDGTHNQGLPSNWTLDITTEGADGSFSGTLTTTSNGNTVSQMANVTGSVTANGSFNLTATDPTTHQVGGSLAGTVSGTTISGTFDDGIGGTGPFSLAKQ
jgi:hypothetical protein